MVAPASTEVSERLPRRYAEYILFDKIGEGGMARIYLGRATTGLGGQRHVVVKEILPMLSSSAEFCQLLIDEAKLSATLSHKNIVQVTDLGREADTLYIAMEYIEGLDLRDLLRLCSRNGIAMPIDFSLFVVMETLCALDYAHRKRDDDGRPMAVVHRDVSPSNVLLSVEGEVKLCDFGIARALTTNDSLPEEAIQGKAGYMSPETASGGAVDARADVFSAGIILWELLSGQRLYRSEGSGPPPLELAQRAEIRAIPERGHPDEATLYGIAYRALQPDPDARYGSAREMLADLEAYVGRNRLVVSPLRFGQWLMEHFGADLVEKRRERERAAQRLASHETPTAPTPPMPSDEAIVSSGAAPSGPESLEGMVHSSQSSDLVPDKSSSVVVWALVAAVIGAIIAVLVLR